VITTEKMNKKNVCYSFLSNSIIIMVLNNMSIISSLDRAYYSAPQYIIINKQNITPPTIFIASIIGRFSSDRN
jgi:hypothetical protein